MGNWMKMHVRWQSGVSVPSPPQTRLPHITWKTVRSRCAARMAIITFRSRDYFCERFPNRLASAPPPVALTTITNILAYLHIRMRMDGGGSLSILLTCDYLRRAAGRGVEHNLKLTRKLKLFLALVLFFQPPPPSVNILKMTRFTTWNM